VIAPASSLGAFTQSHGSGPTCSEEGPCVEGVYRSMDKRQSRQNWWQQGVTTGSSGQQRQMGHSVLANPPVCRETLVVSGAYSYFGPGSTWPDVERVHKHDGRRPERDQA
jgi:hypothetical protein